MGRSDYLQQRQVALMRSVITLLVLRRMIALAAYCGSFVPSSDAEHGASDPLGNITTYTYDAKGNLISVTDALNGITQYEYDANGNKTAIQDANNHRTTFAYDLGNRLTSRTMPNGGIESYTYDASGRQLTKKDAKNQTIQYAYDTKGRLVTKTYPDLSAIQFAYTPSGRRSTVTDSRGVSRYAYDVRGRMLSLTYPDNQAIGYTYDLRGNINTISSLAGTMTYGYSSCCGRLLSVRDPWGNITSYSYDAAGNRTGLSDPNGTTVAYTYDINNRLTNLTHKNGISQVIASYTYTLGPIGNRTAIVEATGIVRQYTYDALYRLTGEQVNDPGNTETYAYGYTYDAVGNRLARTGNSYSYNTADQLLSENGVSYSYDLNGNLVTKSDSSGVTGYTYDYDNRLTSVSSPSGSVSYKYDADGNRVEQATSSGTTRYLVDTNRSLAQVLAEYTQSGSVIASYVYADDLISMARNGQLYFYHFDGLGSTRLLTDGGGNVTDAYDYDAFGNLIARTGTTENPFLFTGQQYDANTGFYYLRARYYQPSNGRFTAYDPFTGYSYEPISLHKYLYANDDPVNKVDPSGEYTSEEALLTVDIIGILARIALPIIRTATIACGVVMLLSAAGYDPGGPINLPCKLPDQEIVVYRGLNGTSPSQFRFDADGLSTFEVLPPGYKCAFPFTLRFKGVKRYGTSAQVIAPVPPCGGSGMYTPPPDGHWSLNYPGNIDDIKKALSVIAKGVCK